MHAKWNSRSHPSKGTEHANADMVINDWAKAMQEWGNGVYQWIVDQGGGGGGPDPIDPPPDPPFE